MTAPKSLKPKSDKKPDNRAFWGKFLILITALAVLGAFFYGTWKVVVPPLAYFLLLYIAYTMIPSKIAKPIIMVLTVIFIAWAFVALGAILVPFLFAMLFAYLLDPIVDIGESWGIPRSLVIIIIFIVFGGGVIVALSIIIPRILAEIIGIMETLHAVPEQALGLAQYLYDQLETIAELENETYNQIISGFMQELTGLFRKLLFGVVNVVQALGTIISTTFSLIIIPFLTFYLLRDIDRLKAFVVDAVPEKNRQSFIDFMWQVDRILSGYFRGQLIMCLIEGSLIALGLSLLGVPYALLLGFIAGLANLIPYVGVLIGGIPAVLVAAFTDDPLHMVPYTVILYLVIQTIDGYIIAPRIIGKRVGLHPALVILSIMVGAKFFGVVGFLLATPTAAIAKLAITRIWRKHRGLPLEDDKEKKPLGKGVVIGKLKRKKRQKAKSKSVAK